ncbi:MAG: hypothetical protein HY347_05195 [candidate division NC10 bacterium]|nr:hypothetical protein [candidate division NC10 bacterium]
MTRGNEDPRKDKISPAFKARLDRLGPRQKVRVIVMLRTKDAGKAPGRRRSREDRQAAIEVIRKSAEQALIDIDKILERFDGRRLATSPDALGSIPVETTAAGITALATSEHVKAILEDQPISLLPRPKYSPSS